MRISKFIFLLFFLFVGKFSVGQTNFLKIDSVGRLGIYTDHVWLFNNTDNENFSKTSVDDQHWDTIHSELDTPHDLKKFFGIGWFRLHVRFDSALKNLPLALVIAQSGAIEIYFDGEKISACGTVSSNEKSEVRKDLLGIPIPINYNSAGEHVIAIRYSNHDTTNSYSRMGQKRPGFGMNVVPAATTIGGLVHSENVVISIGVSLGVFYLVLSLVHLLLWFFYKQNRSNLYYFFFAFTLSTFPFFIVCGYFISDFAIAALFKMIELFAAPLLFIALLNLVYHLFYEKFPKRFKWYFIFGIVTSLLTLFQIFTSVSLIFTFCFSATIDTLFTVSNAVRKRKRGSKIIATGILFFTGFIFLILFSGMFSPSISATIRLDSVWGTILIVLFFIAMISIPVSMSIYLAKDFSETNRSLTQKLQEVEMLSAKTIEQEKEKQKILETQKENLEREVTERTAEIIQQKNVIEEKNKDITASIQYAKRIQQSLFPTEKYMEKTFNRLKNKN